MTTPRPPRLTELQKNNIVRAYQDGFGSDTVALRFGIHPNTVLKLLKKRGIAARPLSKFSNEDVDKMKALYESGSSMEAVGKQFGITSSGVRVIFVKNGIASKSAEEAHRRYEINEDFFDNIDTEEKAYFFWA